MNHENLNGTRHLTQQDIQTPSHFVNEEIVETITTTEAQGSISPIQPSLTTPKLKNPTIQQTIVQPTVKLSVAQKHSQMVYQTFRPVTKPSYKQHKNNFAEHNCNYVNGPKTTKTKTNTQIFAQKQNVPQPILNSVNFHDQPRSSQEPNGNYPFFQQRKNNASNYHTKKSTSSLRTKKISIGPWWNYNQNHQRFSSNQRPRAYRNDQPDIFEPWTRNEQIGQPRTNPTPYNHNFQQQNPVSTHSYPPTQMHIEIPLPYYLQQHESQLTNFSQMPHAAESLQMTMNP